ncbi:uncharacterized protein LOC119725213 [Patiria miniata]|uniref:Uncharacterized protein n=1 Tax=Patiria miniata TaxID=46514 RepID=A0A913ZN17_PATMI|nr:uncharacterized protein LOC119725213 [Patiria miniata]
MTDGAVGNTSIGANAKLNRLFQFCEGEALAVIRCCAMMQPDEGYAKAKELLRERFGNGYRISETWHRQALEVYQQGHSGSGDTVKSPDVYRMAVHLFGGVWSPSFANVALRRTAEDNVDDFNADVLATVKENFYVDDCLKSLDSEGEAVETVKQLTDILAKGGFRLTKWISNSRRVNESVPPEERAKGVKNLDLSQEELPVERALEVHWDTEHDLLRMKIKSKHGSQTRRGLLSVICSVYDPLGFVFPYILRAKLLFQDEFQIVGKSWDDPLEAETQDHWAKWLDKLSLLKEFAVERCLVPSNFGEISECRLHHFSDASQDACGSVSYARFVNSAGEIHCSFLIGKSRPAPLKTMTIPRLELSAAVVAVKMEQMLRRELKLNVCGSTFWTDSMLVLQYIKNTSKRLHTFAANRVAVIHDGSSVDQWRYVNTDRNPADDASRGLDAHNMISKDRWRKGPEFLWQDEKSWPATPQTPNLLETDREVKKVAVTRATGGAVTADPVARLISKYFSWNHLKKAVAWVLRCKKWLIERRSRSIWSGNRLTAAEMDDAELAVIRYVQRINYEQEIRDLEKGRRSVQRQISIYSLEPIIDDNGVLRLGASHMGGVWELPIRTVRKVLGALLKDQVLDDKRLSTMFSEAEAIVNDRPITAVSDDPNDLEALTPSHPLKFRPGHPMPLSGLTDGDKYRKRWRHV